MSNIKSALPSLLRLALARHGAGSYTTGTPRRPSLTPRAAAFRQQLRAWQESGRWAIPVLVLPDAPDPQAGHCVSCGAPAAAWRCTPCLEAIHEALSATEGPW